MSGFFFVSCEIEDDYGKTDTSAYRGTEIYSSNFYIDNLCWSESTNEAVVFDGGQIMAIDISSKQVRQIGAVSGYFLWIESDTLYFIDYDGQLVSIDIINEKKKTYAVDSISVTYGTSSHTASYFAFEKYKPFDPAPNPSLVLYEVATKIETIIANGMPIVFSPDGDKLLFGQLDHVWRIQYFIYNIAAKSITPISFSDPSVNDPKIFLWTDDGIQILYSSYPNVSLYNITTKNKVGQWESIAPIGREFLSKSGKKLLVQREECANPYYGSNCLEKKQVYSLIDIALGSETKLMYANYLYLYQPFILGPDENKVLYYSENKVYIADSQH